MTLRRTIRTARTLYRVWDHRRRGHALIVDPGAVTCQTCTLPRPGHGDPGTDTKGPRG